tara:strand:+ start:169 stop:342 length:174 start_codon:yes stop_codon:yes gene_type:complete
LHRAGLSVHVLASVDRPQQRTDARAHAGRVSIATEIPSVAMEQGNQRANRVVRPLSR